MITLAKARELIQIGDKVFFHDCGVASCTVKRVGFTCLSTNIGWLDYEEHGVTWWLTEKVAKEKWEQCEKIRF